MDTEISDIIDAIEIETGCEVITYKSKKTNWSNDAMGLPKEGKKYNSSAVSGYIMDVKLSCGDCKVYNRVYHSNKDGSILKESKSIAIKECKTK